MSDGSAALPNAAAVCYCTDRGYLLPALVSATSLIRNASSTNFDIFIFTIEIEEETLRIVRDSPFAERIRIIPISPSWRGKYDQKDYKNELNDSALGRLVIHDYIDRRYDRLAYLDGDTYVVGDVTPLLTCALPAGTIGTVDDAVQFSRNAPGSYGRFNRDYLRKLGMRPEDRYFNSGVLVADSDSYKDICAVAFDFLIKNLETCISIDQSALNWASRGRRAPISMRWNSISAYTDRGLGRHVTPVIRHYTGYAKPWATAPDRDIAYKATYNELKNAMPMFRDDVIKPYVPPRNSWGHKVFSAAMTPVWHMRFAAYERTALI